MRVHFEKIEGLDHERQEDEAMMNINEESSKQGDLKNTQIARKSNKLLARIIRNFSPFYFPGLVFLMIFYMAFPMVWKHVGQQEINIKREGVLIKKRFEGAKKDMQRKDQQWNADYQAGQHSSR